MGLYRGTASSRTESVVGMCMARLEVVPCRLTSKQIGIQKNTGGRIVLGLRFFLETSPGGDLSFCLTGAFIEHRILLVWGGTLLKSHLSVRRVCANRYSARM